MKKNLTVWNLFSVVILAAFALFIMYPIFLILYRSVIHGDTGALTLQNSTISSPKNSTGERW